MAWSRCGARNVARTGIRGRIKDTPTNTTLATDATRDQQCFTYDELARLETAWTAKTGDCTQTPSTGGMGGAAPYWDDYEYDLLGNRTNLTTHTAAGTTMTTVNTYGAGQNGPHQLVTSRTNGQTTTYGYDGAGNRTTRTPQSGTATTYTWDVEGELTKVGTDQNVYDVDGNRLVRTDSTGTTIYVGGQEVLITGAGDVKATRYYQFAGKTVAVRTARGLNAVTSLMVDHHGTPVATIPNGGNPTKTPVKRMYTDPFGATRGTSNAATVPGDIQFLGKNRDTGTGLTLLGARYYDEAAGAFISVDPILDLTDPQQWNGYAYAGNSPLTYSDASGLLMLGANDNEGYNARNGKSSTMGHSSSAEELSESQIEDLRDIVAEIQSLGSCSMLGTSSLSLGCGRDFDAERQFALDTVVLTGREALELSDAIPVAGGVVGVGKGVLRGGKELFRGAKAAAHEGADNVANGVKLTQRLARESAESAFTASGELSKGAIEGSRLIIPGAKLNNKHLVERLSSNGGGIAGWGKYATATHQSPSGDFQVHFYMNRGTGAIDYGYDYKVVFNGGLR